MINRTIITSLALWWVSLAAVAQIETVQYWFDSDFSARTTQPSTGSIAELSVSALSEGLHTLHIRAKDASQWSVVHSQVFYKIPAGISSPEITAYEYWIDNDFAGKRSAALSGQTATLTQLDFDELAQGLHTLHIRAKDASQWSVVHSQVFYKMPADISSPEITAYEYWIDNDFAGRHSAALSGQTATLTQLDFDELAQGLHTLHIRAKDASQWSVVHSQVFYKSDVIDSDNGVISYRYWFDDSFDENIAITLDNPLSPYSLDTEYTVPATFAAGEQHAFHIQFRDAAGNWSIATTDTFAISVPTNVPAIIEDDPVVETQYYNLQGIRVAAVDTHCNTYLPTGVYIVRKIRLSGKFEILKTIIKQ